MEWIRQFYEKQDEWIGCCQGEIEGVDRERAACVHRLLAAEPGRVLELGCGGGQTAAAIAELGHTVVAVDISRRAIEAAGERARSVVSGRLIPVLADFFDYEPAGEFDAVVYFDGFGVGEDEDQRRLLHRMAAWMKEGAWALLDVYAPGYWARAAGTEMHFPDASRRYDFDLARTRMLDTWWPKGRRDESVTQSLRCYGPAELKVLLEGTRLRVIDLLPGGALDDATGAYRPLVPLREAMSYRVTLRRQRSSAF